MDYAGRDFRNIRYPVNRPLTDNEWALHYHQNETGSAQPMDFLSVVRLNGTYIELIDRWYPVTGFSVWVGAFLALVGFLFPPILLCAVYFSPHGFSAANAIGCVIAVPVFLAIGCSGVFMIRTESWRWTHYPMRLNRKTRQVYVFRQDSTVLTVPWDELFIVRGEAKSPIAGTTYDLRAHVLDKDGVTVRESFSLGYTFPGDKHSMDKFWAFLQTYMEATDGVERTYRQLKHSLLMPLDGRKEGWRWSIVRTFAPSWPYPWTQFLLCIPLGLNAVGRMFAMWTSKQPRWPKEVEDANTVEVDDPYVLTWRDNGPLGWWEWWCPLLCTVLGVGVFVSLITWALFQL
ncbi:DUF6708 domain-containing protein [Stenotrophomonas sp. MMGLT7]|uniref:DUF6708 domain-containing protein n=1 Tax=Stenotrophomonas sp. MMGLT7 TaxID=2901227 RepID=UPI001E38D158|nr:DUF6708 domain-containing protein [Stenotrophomonas sp. MMGLT7]MCD7099528.1 hypothetical protein [Stenotrophomonas sp. MMGLT7]